MKKNTKMKRRLPVQGLRNKIQKRRPARRRKMSTWDEVSDLAVKGWNWGKKFLPFAPRAISQATSAAASSSSGWVGVAKRVVQSARPPPQIHGMGGIYRMVHGGMLGSIEKSSSAGVTFKKGQEMFSVELSPRIEEWLARMSAFEKYRFRNIAVTYVPALPTTVAAQLLGYFEWDVENVIPTNQGDATLRDVCAHQSAMLCDAWSSHTWSFTNRGEAKDWWYVSTQGHEPRLYQQGLFKVVAATDMDDANLPAIMGHLMVDYDVELTVPELTTTGSISTGDIEVFKAGTVDVTNLMPFGHDPSHVVVKDMGAIPPYVIPQPSAIKYDHGPYSYFQMPAGYWLVGVYVQGTGLGALTVAPFGTYSRLYDVDGAMDAYYMSASTTVSTTFIGLFKSAGVEYSHPWNGYILVHLAAATTTSIVRGFFVPIGTASAVQSSPALNYLRDMIRAIKLERDEDRKQEKQEKEKEKVPGGVTRVGVVIDHDDQGEGGPECDRRRRR